ncbi:MAG: UDP-N-acetylglucosamine 1-carboxyvinyltransferase [Calditrichaeota bacterium]|nr:UDP-N-acetylglucosamine 1-carboxyvinyltransferase [Calditrichota bacterium]MCB9391634.1 UDP-N-acetylglucosamine 1-carboxyvinyltransferase [Calditrichota bacterium]
MDSLLLHGGHPLEGEIPISGSKNATLPLLAATLLAPGFYRFTNVPKLKDVRTMSNLLRILGAKVDELDHELLIDTSHASHIEAPYELVKTMRASFYVLGALLGRHGEARVSLPGGCAWGPRPVDLHLKGMEALGAKLELDAGYVVASAYPLRGTTFEFATSSVGASANVLMAAVRAEGTTVLKNVALEPEVTQLALFLNRMGARISGIGTREWSIQGVADLQPADAVMIPDRIETGSYICAVGMTGGKVKLTHADPQQLPTVLDKAREAGLKVTLGAESLTVERTSDHLKPLDITTDIYPGFPTDLQAPFMAMSALASGESRICETIYTDRFTHVAELARLGADIRVDGPTAHIHGVKELKGAPVMSTDLRASVCLVLAGLAASGETEVKRVYHLDRGYEKLEEKLTRVGADIRRIEGDL